MPRAITRSSAARLPELHDRRRRQLLLDGPLARGQLAVRRGHGEPRRHRPVGQTAAAGNFQQPQYADARWPGKIRQGDVRQRGRAVRVRERDVLQGDGRCSVASTGLSAERSRNVRARRVRPPAPGRDGGVESEVARPARAEGPVRRLEAQPPMPPVHVPTVTTPTVPGTTLPTPTVMCRRFRPPARHPPRGPVLLGVGILLEVGFPAARPRSRRPRATEAGSSNRRPWPRSIPAAATW